MAAGLTLVIVLLAQASAEPTPLEQLDAPTRATLLMALFALVITGLALIGLTMIGARWVRRELRDRKPPRQWPSRQDMHVAPVDACSQSQDGPQSGPLGETLAGRPGDQDTRSDPAPDA